MTIFIALLRGINVGGKNIIKMNELKHLFEAMGLSDVKTYIQSGNILFKSNEKEELLCKKIEFEIKKAFGFPVTVVLRTAEEIQTLVDNCPFSEQEILQADAFSGTESLYVAFLKKVPSQEMLEALNVYQSEKEKYVFYKRDLYLLCFDSIRYSKIATNIQKSDNSATIRNWKTINKLVQLYRAM